MVKGDETETVYEPRSQDQIKKLENIIKNAVGIDEDRGDQISVVNIGFETKEIDDLEIGEPSITNDFNKITNLVLIVLAIIVSIFLLKGIMKKLKSEKMFPTKEMPDSTIMPTYTKPQVRSFETNIQNNLNLNRNMSFMNEGDLEDEITDEAMLKKSQHDKISSYVSKNPEDAARLINSWLHKGEYQT